MKKFMFLLLIMGIVQGCQTNNSLSERKSSSDIPPTIEFGSTCRINYCSECRIQSCPIGGQDLVGASCSCNTRNGIQNGFVGR